MSYKVSTEPFKKCSSSFIIVSNFVLLSEWWIKEKLIWFNLCFFFFFNWFQFQMVFTPSNGLNGDGREMQIHFHKNNNLKNCPEYFHPYLKQITRSTEKTFRICKGDLNLGRKGLCFGCSLSRFSSHSFLLPLSWRLGTAELSVWLQKTFKSPVEENKEDLVQNHFVSITS